MSTVPTAVKIASGRRLPVICHVRQTRQPQPNLEFLRQARSDGHITQECYHSIAEDNALRVFDIEG